MYIEKEKRKIIDESIAGIQTLDDLVYAISTFILKMWNSKPNSETLFVLTKELSVDPKNSKFVNDIRTSLSTVFTVSDIYTACKIAFNEFDNRVGRLQRAKECRENADIDGYSTALEPLLKSLRQEIQKEAASQLIVPQKG